MFLYGDYTAVHVEDIVQSIVLSDQSCFGQTLK